MLAAPDGSYVGISGGDFLLQPFSFSQSEDGNISLNVAGAFDFPKMAAGVKDFVSLVDNLRAAGAIVDPAGTVSQPFFDPEGQLLTVNGEDVQSFEFASEVEAAAIAESISADGGSVGTSCRVGLLIQ